MPGEPKHKHSKARKRTRRAAIILKSTATFSCPNCGQPTLPHQVCKNCGTYRSKKVISKTTAVVTKA